MLLTAECAHEQARMLQEATSELDAQVAEAVEQLKALKVSLGDLEKDMEKVTGIPLNKGAFQKAVVRIYSPHAT